MKHLGDITKINGAEIEPVDCITFGSPCQDLSIAGKRAGLAGARSGLFAHAVRIIKEMRHNDATNGRATKQIRPRFAVWENVPGAFSSNGGEDFRVVLEELARIGQAYTAIPRPNGKWSKAGAIDGDGWSLAWRTLDAQYWGVPQRRRRIALVVDFAGGRAREILFERTGVQGDFAQGEETWKSIAGNHAHRPAGHDSMVGNECLTPWAMQQYRVYHSNGKWHTLCVGNGSGYGYVMQPVCYDADTAATLVDGMRWILRRLTPIECERLQGYPDGWTDIGEWIDSKGKRRKSADSLRYKVLGNTIALPQWWWITCKMAEHLPQGATLGSLFDGIGGFPLVWETRHGQSTARWASEIDEFPMAVTRARFADDVLRGVAQ